MALTTDQTVELMRNQTPFEELVRKTTTAEAEIKKAITARSALLDALYNLSFFPEINEDLFDFLKSQLRPRRIWDFVSLFLLRISKNVKIEQT